METKTYSLYKGKHTLELKIGENGSHAFWGESLTEMKKDGKPKKVRIPGTTTIIKSCIDKSTPLMIWQGNLIINFLKENQDRLLLEDTNQILNEAKEQANLQRDLAAEIGSAIHAWIESHIKGEEPAMPEDNQVINGVNSFLEWIDQQGEVKLIESERVVYNPELGVCGIVDIIAEINGEKYLLDIKTGNGVYEDYLAQTANYSRSVEMEDGLAPGTLKRVILRISKETEEKYHERMMKKEYYAMRVNEIPPYKIFEATYLDNEPDAIFDDYEAFAKMVGIYKWLAKAKKRLGNNF